MTVGGVKCMMPQELSRTEHGNADVPHNGKMNLKTLPHGFGNNASGGRKGRIADEQVRLLD